MPWLIRPDIRCSSHRCHDARSIAMQRWGFQGRLINSQRLAFDQILFCQHLEDPLEYVLVRIQVQPELRSWQTRVIRSSLVQLEAQKLSQGQRIRTSQGNPAF